METPSSTARVTRSQTLAALNKNNNSNIPISRKIEDSEKDLSKSRKRPTNTKQQDRSALIDITNDSPIVGVASGSLETPSSGMTKQRTFRGTPGSGENLLRGQVKTLLQRVEEEAELSKLSLESRPLLHLQGLVNSPLRLLAPTPANTPQILNLSGVDGALGDNDGLASMNPSPVIQEQLISQLAVIDVFDGKKQETIECDKNLTRSLLFDFSEKLEFSNSSTSECSSVVTDQGGLEASKEKSSSKSLSTPDDDDSSIWSIQVNASSTHDEDEEEVIEEEEGVEAEDDYDPDEDEEGLLDELCEGVSRISVNTTTTIEKVMAEFTGKHTRFVYNSDEEIVEDCDAGGLSPSVLRLQGLPTPKGKHLRFPIEEEGSD